MLNIDLSDGTNMPAIGFGTYRLKGEECTTALRSALEIGYRHIDTALYYQNHTAIAPAIQDYPRDELFLVSKLPSPDCHDGTILPACQRILDELQTDYIDLLLIHAPDRSIPIAETLGRMQECQQKRWVRSIGVSNFTTRHCTDALATKIPFVTNQVEFHPYLYQKELLDFAKARNILLTAYCPIVRGKTLDDPILKHIADQYNKTPAQISLRWLLQHRLAVIPMSTNPTHQKQNLDLFDFQLSPAEMSQINALHTGLRLAHGDWTDFNYL